MRYITNILLAAIMAVAATAASAQAEKAPPKNVVNITTDAEVELPQDWLMVTLSSTEQGADATAVKQKLTDSTNSALATIRKGLVGSDKKVARYSTKRFSITPSYDRTGKINGWTGRSEVLLEGSDIPLIAETAGLVKTMNVASTNYTVSKESVAAAEANLRSLVIEKFKAYSMGVASDFGFKSYSIKEVTIGSSGQFSIPAAPRLAMAMAKAELAQAPIPVEAGSSTMRATASGSIVLEK